MDNRKIKVQPIKTIGKCPLGIFGKDQFYINGNEIITQKNCKLCFLSITHLYWGIWAIQNNNILISHMSCPGCTNDITKENRVIFMMGYEENWKLGEIINEYNKFLEKYPEPIDARNLRLKAESFFIGEKINFEKAYLGMKTALKMFKRCCGTNSKIYIF